MSKYNRWKNIATTKEIKTKGKDYTDINYYMYFKNKYSYLSYLDCCVTHTIYEYRINGTKKHNFYLTKYEIKY
ncbi:hypothetical protein [Spiroplasma sp. AdecLV25b]|uniref:hypothetical protein n=1 Tax=Spiroplasma sp. AdecLV25b TaxID=3027162 RepID=UPI0027E11977|nr:hypothetical protein [Spiroplasma sp. AdecLV25b]